MSGVLRSVRGAAAGLPVGSRCASERYPTLRIAQSHTRVGAMRLNQTTKFVLHGATIRAGARRARTARAIAFAITIGFDANLSAIFDIFSYLPIAAPYGVSLSESRFATAVASKFVRITPGSMRQTSMPNGSSS